MSAGGERHRAKLEDAEGLTNLEMPLDSERMRCNSAVRGTSGGFAQRKKRCPEEVLEGSVAWGNYAAST